MVNLRLCQKLRYIQVQKFYDVFKSQCVTSVIGNYLRDVSICEQYIVTLY
jgi:hypothetical protein